MTAEVHPRVLVQQCAATDVFAWKATLHVYELTERRAWYKPVLSEYGDTVEEAVADLCAADTRAIGIDPEINALPAPSSTFQYDDGGRGAAGFKGHAGDCVTRAIAIATGLPYREVYDALFDRNRELLACGKIRGSASPRDGVTATVYKPYITGLGWVWTPTMQVGSGTRVHVDAKELPSGRLILRLSRHLAAMVDGVLHDTGDCSRGGTRAVYGYWSQP